MKLLYFLAGPHFFVWGFLFLTLGCVSEPVRTELAIHHPANPRAPETPFARPPLLQTSSNSLLVEWLIR